MFKKTSKKIDKLFEFIKGESHLRSIEFDLIKNMVKQLPASIALNQSEATKIIESQQRTIEQLTSALQNKCKHGAPIVMYGLDNSGDAPNECTTAPQAEWIICSDGYYPYCSHCGEEPNDRKMAERCPNCDAEMKKRS